MPNYGGPYRGCGTCRMHKQKCDQTYPICDRCHRSDRLCLGTSTSVDSMFRYNTNGSANVRRALVHTTHHQLPGRVPSNVTYRSFAQSLICHYSLHRLSSSHIELIGARLIGFLPIIAGFGQWLELLPRNLGRARYVDEACNSLNHLLEAHCCRGEKTAHSKPAIRGYLTAVELLRPQMRYPLTDDTVLLCIALLAMLEQLARSWHDSYESQIHDAFVHWRGIAATFLALQPPLKWRETVLALWDSCWEPVVVVPVAQGTSCQFETEDWLTLEPHVDSSALTWAMRKATNQLKIRLPRMVLYVRQIWNGSAEVSCVDVALDLAYSLQSIIETQPDAPLTCAANLLPAKDELLRRLGIEQLVFPTIGDLESFTVYNKAVVWIGALCANLVKRQTAVPGCGRERIFTDMVEAGVRKLLSVMEMAQRVGPFAMVRLVQGLIIGRAAMISRDFWNGVPMAEVDNWLKPRLKLELNISAAYDEHDLDAIVQLKLGKPGVDCVVKRVAQQLI